MKRIVIIGLLFLAVGLDAKEKIVRGKVTYMASGAVYTSLGRESGVQDSTVLFITSNMDTTATLRVYAVSSKSSACTIIKAVRPVSVGDGVMARVIVEEQKFPDDSSTMQPRSGSDSSVPVSGTRLVPAHQEGALKVQGRVSAQYLTSLYDNQAFNIAQPGLVLNMRGTARDIPLTFDVYANFRSLALGGRSPFAKGGINQSRLYGLSLSYDDGENLATIGRIIPSFSPLIGYVDGGLLSRRFGNIVVGAALGFQPDFDLRGVSGDFKKIALFAQYLSADRVSLSVSTAYARTFYHSASDREAASILLNASLTNALYLYANGEVDLRKKSGENFILSPQLTSLFVNLNYRIASSFSVGLGIDASRPYYSFQSVRSIPDSFLFDNLRSGVSLSVNWYLPGGIALYNSYTPRNSEQASFGREYANYSSVNIADVFSSGVNLRSNINLNTNQYTKALGYGVGVQRTFAQLVDFTVRYQQNNYTIKLLDQQNTSTTIGADVMVFMTNSLSFLATFDRLKGYGTTSHSVFAEISVRF